MLLSFLMIVTNTSSYKIDGRHFWLYKNTQAHRRRFGFWQIDFDICCVGGRRGKSVTTSGKASELGLFSRPVQGGGRRKISCDEGKRREEERMRVTSTKVAAVRESSAFVYSFLLSSILFLPFLFCPLGRVGSRSLLESLIQNCAWKLLISMLKWLQIHTRESFSFLLK